MPARVPSLTAAMLLEKELSIVASELIAAKAGGLADSALVANSALEALGTWEKVDSRALSPVTASGAIFSLVTEPWMSEDEASEPWVIFAAVTEPLASLPCLSA